MKQAVVCIGSTLIDELYFCKEEAILGTSNPSVSKKFPGGVISNIARHLALLNVPVELITIFGNDADGNWLRDQLTSDGVELKNSFMVSDNTGKYVSVLNPDGSLFTATCSDICADHLDTEKLESITDVLKSARLIITDTNSESSTIEWLIDFCKKEDIKIIIEPVSVAKARKLSKINLENVFMITPNEDELFSIGGVENNDTQKAIDEILKKGVKSLWLRKGKHGSVIYNNENNLSLAAAAITVKDSTGAGDAALAGWVTAYIENYVPMDCLKAGHTLAFEVLQTEGAVKTDLNKKFLFESINKYYPNGDK